MISEQRKNELRAAYETISGATREEKRFLFNGYTKSMEETYNKLQSKENPFNPHLHIIHNAVDNAFHLLRSLTGYSVGWVEDELIKHSARKPGRNKRYDLDDKIENSIFISLLVNRGASETQAMKLLMRLRGDFSMAASHLNELRSTHKEFKANKNNFHETDDIVRNAWAVARYIKFDISHLQGEEIASKRAVEAFRSFWKEIIEKMKEYHPTIRKKDSAYPEYFGCVIDWVQCDYEDPLDYFYTHPSHHEIPFEERRYKFLQYLNDINHYARESIPEQLV